MTISTLKNYLMLVALGAGIAIGIVSMALVQRCDVEAAMKPLVYVINELSRTSR